MRHANNSALLSLASGMYGRVEVHQKTVMLGVTVLGSDGKTTAVCRTREHFYSAMLKDAPRRCTSCRTNLDVSRQTLARATLLGRVHAAGEWR